MNNNTSMANNHFGNEDFQRFNNLLTLLMTGSVDISKVNGLMTTRELDVVERINEFYPAFTKSGNNFSIRPEGMKINQIGILQHIENLRLEKETEIKLDKRKSIISKLGWIFGTILVIIGLIFSYLAWQHPKQAQQSTEQDSKKDSMKTQPISKTMDTVSVDTIKRIHKSN